MELIPPTLEEVGFMLWGASWHEPMAVSIGVTNEELQQWRIDPLGIPLDVEKQLLELCIIRRQEIGRMHGILQATGLRRGY